MAAPHNLSFHSNNHTNESSLETPDASSLLSETTPRILSNNQRSFQSLEDLLNDVGVPTNVSTESLAGSKRSLSDAEFPVMNKKFKIEESNVGMSTGLTSIPNMGVSTGLTSIPNMGMSASLPSVPSLLSHSSSNLMQQSKNVPLTASSSSSIPLINPASFAVQSSNSLTTPPIANSGTNSTLPSATQSPLALGSISLLVQLYKQFQTQGNVQGMQKIKEQLSVLQSQLIARSKTLSAQTGLTGTINITPTGGSQSNSFQPVLVPAVSNTSSQQALNGPSIVTNGIMHGRSNNNVLPSSLHGSSTNIPSTSSLNSFANDLLMSSKHTSSQSNGSQLSSSSTAALLQSNSLINSGLATSSLPLNPPLPVSMVTTSSTSPSFVTHMTPSAAQLPLGLQVTPQTQANVLKAVYSYRLQQIQDFLSSLPPSQKPTTTNELRELLIKNNVLSKALPADFLTQLQKISPQDGTQTNTASDLLTSGVSIPGILSSTAVSSVLQSAASATPVVPVTTPIVTSSTSVPSVSTAPPTLSTPSSSSTNETTPTTTPASNNISLPGVTLETLKTLCRLPEADFIRIPMPAMLMTIVHYLRSNKWAGNGSDLPGLLKQAQDALTKNTLTSVTPATSGVHATKLSSTPGIQRNGTGSSSSPLSQLMASFGMKGSPGTSNNATTLLGSKPSLTTPITRLQSKAYQEQLEREKIANLQKLLQSSEEARIAFRFKAHVDKLNQQLLSPDVARPFNNWQDLILRLLPYHVYREPELPAGAMEKADAVYEGIAGVLLSRAQGLMSRYQQIVVREQVESGADRAGGIVLDRLWIESEIERQGEEERQRQEAEQIAAELSVVGGGLISDTSLDTDPFLLDCDSYDDDPFLTQMWEEGLLGPPNDYTTGIT